MADFNESINVLREVNVLHNGESIAQAAHSHEGGFDCFYILQMRSAPTSAQVDQSSTRQPRFFHQLYERHIPAPKSRDRR